MSAGLEQATEHQARARVALTAALAAGAVARLPLPRAARVGQARRRAGLRRRDPRQRRRGPRRRPPPRPARSLAAPRPRLARPARRSAPGRGGAGAGDPRRRLPALRRRQARLRRRGGGGDARREPERAAEDARGAARVRPPDPAQLRAGGAAGDDRLPLPAGRLRPALGRGAGGRACCRWAESPPYGRRIGPSIVAPEEIAAAARLAAGDLERARLLLGERGREVRAEAERCVAAALEGEVAGAPWKRLLERAEAAGEEVEAATREVLEEEAKSGLKRTARDIADESKRAGRRRRTEILDLGLELCAAWLRDLAAVAGGAEDVVFNRDRLEQLALAGRRPRPRPRPPRRRGRAGDPPQPRPQRLRGAGARGAVLPPRARAALEKQPTRALLRATRAPASPTVARCSGHCR